MRTHGFWDVMPQDALPCFPDVDAFACIEKELGRPLESMYSSITASPIAAASLGQVYKAKLRSTGDTVAVKVQRPAIEESVGLDFYLLRGLCGLVDKYVDIITSDVVALLDEFARRVYQELNYVQVTFHSTLNDITSLQKFLGVLLLHCLDNLKIFSNWFRRMMAVEILTLFFSETQCLKLSHPYTSLPRQEFFLESILTQSSVLLTCF